MRNESKRLRAIAESVIIAVTFVSVASADEAVSFKRSPSEASVQRATKWMAKLPDKARLSEISIPGTHDTCALHNGLSFGFAKCQTWPLDAQLKAGIRFLDIRCRHLNDQFEIYHGVIDQRIGFDEVQRTCLLFLKQHPTECIVMSVKEESTPEGNRRSFQHTFAAAIESERARWLLAKHVPELKAARGRIVLIDRVGRLGGMEWRRLKRQDDYQASIEKKSILIRQHIDAAIAGNANDWYINFCSGSIPAELMTPTQYAVKSNQTALDHLSSLTVQKPFRLGIIVMDFPGERLIETIINSNFKK